MIDWTHLTLFQIDKIAITGLSVLVGNTVFCAVKQEAGTAALCASASVILLGMIWMSHHVY